MKILVIVGPTGVGKTKLSIELAKKYKGEIINADSTQIYKGLDIATAKVTEEEKDNIVHHLIDIKEIDDNYTVYNYQIDARKKIDEIINNEKTPIIVGGTGLYIKALLYNYEFNEENENDMYLEYSSEQLYEKLIEIDPKTEIHPNNRKRIVRALNYYKENNEPISNKNKSEDLLYDPIIIGLTTKREILYENINKRVDKMLELGLLEEAYGLYKKNNYSKAVMTPIGYKELFLYFDKQLSYEESIALIKQRSRQYAKKQYTWFNNQMNVKWFDVVLNEFDETVKTIYQYIDNIKC